MIAPFLDLNVSISNRLSFLAPTGFYSPFLLNILQASRSVQQLSINSLRFSAMPLVVIIIMVPHFIGEVLLS